MSLICYAQSLNLRPISMPEVMARDASAEGTGRKGTFELNKTLGSQLNRTHLRIWNVQIFDLVPPSGQKIDFKNMDFSIIFYFFDLLRTFFGCKWHKINERI